MTDRAAQLRTLATSFYRELMRLADEMDTPRHNNEPCSCQYRRWTVERDPACPVHGVPAMDPALDC